MIDDIISEFVCQDLSKLHLQIHLQNVFWGLKLVYFLPRRKEIMSDLKNVYIIGVGNTACGRFPDKPAHILARQAAWEAIKDADIHPRKIEIASVRYSACSGC